MIEDERERKRGREEGREGEGEKMKLKERKERRRKAGKERKERGSRNGRTKEERGKRMTTSDYFQTATSVLTLICPVSGLWVYTMMKSKRIYSGIEIIIAALLLSYSYFTKSVDLAGSVNQKRLSLQLPPRREVAPGGQDCVWLSTA